MKNIKLATIITFIMASNAYSDCNVTKFNKNLITEKVLSCKDIDGSQLSEISFITFNFELYLRTVIYSNTKQEIVVSKINQNNCTTENIDAYEMTIINIPGKVRVYSSNLNEYFAETENCFLKLKPIDSHRNM